MSLEDYFREQAERCSMLADECGTPAIRAGLLKLAIEYASRADEIKFEATIRVDA